MESARADTNSVGRRLFWLRDGLRVPSFYYRFALYVFALSFLIHMPCRGCLGEYSDLGSLFFQVFSGPERWFGGAAGAMGIPYVDYRFEYPPVVAGIFYLTSAISLVLSEWTGAARSDIFYYVLALLFLLPAYVVYVKTVKDTSSIVNAKWSRLALAAAGFGIAYYTVYNFDIIAVGFAVLSLLLLINGRKRSAGFLLGLSVASKILTGIILFPSLLYLTRRSPRSAEGFLVSFSLAIAASFGPVLIFASRGFQELLQWHASWYCENCFYVMMVPDIGDTLWKQISMVLMIAVPLGIMYTVRHRDDRMQLISRSLLMIPATISVSYVYSPQMNVMIAPTYLLASGPLALGALAFSDFLNVLIMVFFFRSEMLCSVFGIQTCPGVWGRESPVQWIAFTRIMLLWAFIAIAAIRITLKSDAVKWKTR